MKNNIEIRLTTEKDKHRVKDLWKYAFSDSDEFITYYFEKRFNPNHTIGLFKNGCLEAALQLNPYNLAIGDVILPVNYVVGVSVQPESRGQGLMTKIMRATLNMQYERGEDFSILMPIDTRLYTRYGYSNCFMRHEFHVDLARLAPKSTKYKIKRLDMANVENLDRELHLLSEVYFDAVQENYSFVSRNRTYWKNKLAELSTDGGEIFIVSDDFSPKGYAMVIPRSQDRTLQVIEMVALDNRAFDAIMGIVKGHSTQAERAVLVTPQNKEFGIYTDYDNNISHIVKPFMMGRIINVERVLDHIIQKSEIYKKDRFFEEDDHFCISVSDDMIEENNYTALYKRGRMADATREVCESCLPDRRLKMTVSELAQLYLKSATVSKLNKMGRLEVYEKDIELFEEIFGCEFYQNYINDFI